MEDNNEICIGWYVNSSTEYLDTDSYIQYLVNKSRNLIDKIKDSDSLKIKKKFEKKITFLLIDFDEVLDEDIGYLVKMPILIEMKTLKRIQRVLNNEIRRIEELDT